MLRCTKPRPRHDPRLRGTISRIFHPILYVLACATRQEPARQVKYLKVENEVLRARLPKAVGVTPAGRRRLVRAGKRLGKAAK